MTLLYDANGLIPAIVQHAHSGEVLMLGYMNADALAQTQASGNVTFFSRSRQQLWVKGETSGNFLRFVEVRRDCDSDALLVLALPIGPTCHTGTPSCFAWQIDGQTSDQRVPPLSMLGRLSDLVVARKQQMPEGSYTTKLFTGGVDRIGKKIGEEAAEMIIAAKNNSDAELTWETADFLYHALVLLTNQGVSLDMIMAELARRHSTTD
ncbi:MAG: bifunctional phosphoribosyl-AMP cyclohydrolase/phosphoribosyl-ATP diphosphatase HisIE [Chloroflexi bacterium]|jgi:phosphoribosyl-AMP cyclohydrolase / phosphoribosyl-ATP pyrophosphohydrolase|nr:MAG: bifunctional phosphoribosyl-AMP cyclohydrolase/phosphoribosyl-ATP diphosphatase HisIE [Chloroflexota bacterium]